MSAFREAIQQQRVLELTIHHLNEKTVTRIQFDPAVRPTATPEDVATAVFKQVEAALHEAGIRTKFARVRPLATQRSWVPKCVADLRNRTSETEGREA